MAPCLLFSVFVLFWRQKNKKPAFLPIFWLHFVYKKMKGTRGYFYTRCKSVCLTLLAHFTVVRGFRGSCRSAWARRLSQALPCARYRLGAQNRPCLPPAVHRVPVTTVWCVNPLFEPGPATCPRPPRCGRGAPAPPETPAPRPNPAALPGAGLVRLRRAALP